MNPQCPESDTVLDEGQGDHTVELGPEGLMGGEVLDEGEVVHEHLFAAAFDGIVDEIEQPLLLKAFDAAVDEVLGDTEVLLGEAVDLMGGHGLGVVACQDENERLFVRAELLLEELLHQEGGVPALSAHGRQGAGFEEMVEGHCGRTAALEGEELLVVQGKELHRREAALLQRDTAQDDEASHFRKSLQHPLFVMIEDQLGNAVLLYEGLQRQGVKCVENEIGVFEIDVECLFSPPLQVVQNECCLAAAPCPVKVDIPLLGNFCFSQNEMVVYGGMCMVMFQKIHLKYSKLSFL